MYQECLFKKICQQVFAGGPNSTFFFLPKPGFINNDMDRVISNDVSKQTAVSVQTEEAGRVTEHCWLENSVL
jgi:hypothetical protein